MCALDACYLGKFSKWTREAREAGERSRGSTECKESSHGAGGEKPTVEAFVGWEAATVTGKRGQRGPGKGRESCLSLPERRVF